MAKTLKMEDILKTSTEVDEISKELVDISEAMQELYDERSRSANEAIRQCVKLEEKKQGMRKAKKDFERGEIDEEEYIRRQDEFCYIKRCAKRAIKANEKASGDIRTFRKRKDNLKDLLLARI